MKIFTKDWFVNRDTQSLENVNQMYENYLLLNQQLPMEMINNLHMHDAVLIKMEENSETVKLYFDITGAGTNVKAITFHNADVHQNENVRAGDYWCYEELYSSHEQYHLHILFCDNHDNPKQMIIQFDECSFEYDVEKKKTKDEMTAFFHQYKNASLTEKMQMANRLRDYFQNR